MKFKYYFVATFIFVVLLGLYVYSLSGYNYSYVVPFSGSVITLPVALWFVIPIFIFFLVVVGLEIGGIFRLWRKRQAYKKDYKLLLEQLEVQLLGKDIQVRQPKMNRYKALSILIHNMNLDVKEGISLKSGNDRLDELIALLGDIKRGEYVNLKKFNVDINSNLAIQNTLNQIVNDSKFALDVLKKSVYKDEIRIEALKKTLSSDGREAKKFIFDIKLNKDILNEIFAAFKNGKIEFDIEEISNLCLSVEYNRSDYVKFAHDVKERFEPSEWLNLFRMLAASDDNAELAYLYVLLELEMIDEVKDKLDSCAPDEFLNIRAYMDLKSIDKKYPIELFVG